MMKMIITLVVSVLLPVSNYAQASPYSLHDVLLKELSEQGWSLTFSTTLDHTVSQEEYDMVNRIPSLGVKIRYLTAQGANQGKFDVWACDSNKMLAVMGKDEIAPSIYGCHRLFQALDFIGVPSEY